MSHDFDDDQKASSGSVATWAWLFTGGYLFWTTERSPNLLSWEAGLFLVVGMFLAAIVIGMAIYGSQKLLAKALTLFIGNRRLHNRHVVAIKTIGVLNFTLGLALSIAAAYFCFQYLFL